MHSSFCRNIFTSHLCECSDLGICHLPWEELNRNWLQPDHSEISGELKFYLLIFTKHLGLEIVFDMKIIFICVPSDMGYRSALPGKLQAPWVLKASGCGNASQVLSMCIPGTNPVKTESWSCQGWKEPLEVILFNTPVHTGPSTTLVLENISSCRLEIFKRSQKVTHCLKEILLCTHPSQSCIKWWHSESFISAKTDKKSHQVSWWPSYFFRYMHALVQTFQSK